MTYYYNNKYRDNINRFTNLECENQPMNSTSSIMSSMINYSPSYRPLYSETLYSETRNSEGSVDKPYHSNIEALTERMDRLVIPRYRNRKRVQKRFNGPPPGKFWWKDDLGRDVAAGGILILDTQIVNGVKERGIWVISEKSRKNEGTEYTDFGGRYNQDDGDIYATIHREFREETYNTNEIPYSVIKKLATDSSNENKFVYRMVKGKYLCLVVDREYLPPLNLDNCDIQSAKQQVIKSNPYVAPEVYRTENLVFIPFSKLKKGDLSLSFRLNEILSHSPLRNKIEFSKQNSYNNINKNNKDSVYTHNNIE